MSCFVPIGFFPVHASCKPVLTIKMASKRTSSQLDLLLGKDDQFEVSIRKILFLAPPSADEAIKKFLKKLFELRGYPVYIQHNTLRQFKALITLTLHLQRHFAQHTDKCDDFKISHTHCMKYVLQLSENIQLRPQIAQRMATLWTDTGIQNTLEYCKTVCDRHQSLWFTQFDFKVT